MHLARNFILTTTEHFYNKPSLKLDDAEDTLSEFINNSQNLLIQSCNNEDKLAFNTQIQSCKDKCLIFYKNSSQPIIDDNGAVSIKNINIITLSNNAAESLYHTLKQVYTPLLTAENDVYSIKLQKYLTDLEDLLKTLTHGKGASNDVTIIFNIQDEVDYWKAIGLKKDVSKKEKEAVSTFCDLFQDISEELRVMQSSSVSEMRESTENIGGLLDDVWRFTTLPYSQHRMTHVFDIVGYFICSLLQKTLSAIPLWKLDNDVKEYEILTLLSDSLKVAQTWTSACKSLTETYWPNYALHPWNGKPYIPLFCQKFESRLKEILDIRSTHSQLIKLLSNSEKSELQTHTLFAPFESINIWLCNGPNTSWETAVSKFSASLRPAEAKIAEKLKPRLHNTSTKQMLYEFMRYRALIERPLVKRALNNELEIFVSSLLSLLKSIQTQMDSDDVDVQMHQPPEMSPVVLQIQWAKQMEAKVKEVHICAEKYLKEFEGSSQLLKLATQLLKELKTMYTQLHEEWSRDLQAQAKNGLLQLSSNKPVVEFSSDTKLLQVVFLPRLVWAELEARALAALGLPPPPAAAALDHISTTLTQARALQQVASFHNTLGERMIPSTRPMMLQAALELSSLVQNQKAVYWNDTEQLENYTDKLKKAVLKLESQNSYLTAKHAAIRNIVEKLMDTELLAKQSEWKKGVKEIRDIIENVEANGHKSTELWRSHWDWQLYKALECQYIKTLLTLHKHFPHVKVDLVLRGHSVRVQPPMEELRVQHYHQLRRLVSLPAHFVGLQNSLADKSIFTDIVNKHSWLGNKAVSQLEAALSSLELACKTWTKRAALACVPDLEALCSQHLNEPHDWEINFKACKAYGQAIAKMTFEDEKIHWISIGTATLRREFEAQTRSLWACLISSLQTSCRNDATEIEAFIANATVMLENKTLPKNAKELAEISGKQQALQQKMPDMEQTIEALKKKGHMLRTWGGDASVDGTIREWQRVRELMSSQQQMFQHQAEIVKSSLKGEWENLNTGVEAWLSRWSQAKSRFEETHGVNYNEMADRCRSVFDASEQWSKFVADKNELIKECEKFNMDIELTESWQQAETLIKESDELWTVFRDYNEELNSIADQDWLIFQKKIHLLDEFTSKWKGCLEPYTAITLYIQQELEKYSDLTTVLKYVRGTDFTERHWREVFSLLEMEYKKPETLVVRDLLGVANQVKKHLKVLQKICTSATSESAIRSALNELELWFAGARLNIIYYNDKAKRQTPIVKDFKEILNKIEEQQWVISSLSGGDAAAACTAWETRLRASRQLVRATHHAQRRWLYLEPILSNDDGDLGAKFRKVDQGFRQVTRILESDSRLTALLQSTRLQPMLDSISEQLLACQSALNQYIDEKRSIFPRLYFLSDDDLLELLGQARAGADGREVVMQAHLKKLFPGTTGVRLGPGEMSITAMCSHHGETFQLEHPIDIDCPVEVWLKNLETEMRSSLKNMTLKCVVTNSLQEQDPFTMPTQILCLAQNIRFTEQAERAILSRELHKLKATIEKENFYYASADVEDESERNKRQALLLQCAHYVSVIRILIEKNVTSTNDWLWQKQLRFYLMSTKDVIAKMGLAQISYSYEYLGVNTGQFVRTQLADECFLILTQSLHLGLVGNPFGPAGTGKTESVKALGGLVGRLVLIFNCDEAMDAECMGRLLTGLSLCGAWGCFDEFNRLTADTLAAISHQLASLLNALQHKPNPATAILNGKQVSVSEWCGVAATMNPAGRGYGGRRALPAALERVMRPIAMLQPRTDHLAAHLLAARCILNADKLALDLHNVYTMASSLLSAQRHYDWGLRALKAAVGSCGTALQAHTSAPLESQRASVRRVLALNNMSKLTRQDAERFENILSLVFSGVPVEESTSDPIAKAIEASSMNLKLTQNGLQVRKCVEFYEQLQQRMGVVIVGPPGSGKTTIRRLLKNALTIQGKNIVEHVICPKAMSRDWLLGSIDHDTRQWTDGVISTTALEVSNQPPDVWSWVVCDGDIDPEWVESLNSVLDDNRLLTLPSGWRIQFGTNVNFIFETHSLEHASPATVSRMGVILLSEDVSCEIDLLSSWMKRADIDNDNAKSSLPLLYQVIKKCVQWFSAHKNDVLLKLCNVTLVKPILVQYEYVVQNLIHNPIRTSPEDIVYEAVERSITDIVKENSIASLHEELSSILGPPPPTPISAGEWVSESLYLSPRLASCEPVLRACLNSDRSHLLIIGPDACAKNLIAEYIVKECNSTIIIIDCTPILEPSDIIAELKRNNVVRSGGESSASNNVRVTLLVRSLHRARVDAWGSSAVHSFLLQLIEHRGFWCVGGQAEGASAAWCGAARLRVLASADTSAMQPRLAAALTHCKLNEPDDDEVLELVKTWLKQNADKNIQPKEITALATAILAMYKEVTDIFHSRSHYKWNASHLKRWCENVKWYSPTNKDELAMAIAAEANMIFRDRLVTEEEKSRFNKISRNYLKIDNDDLYFTCKLKGDGVYLELVDYGAWHQSTQKLINQCLSEYEHNVFGETGAEVCSELAVLCPATARASNGGMLSCVGSAGVGRRAAALLTAASLPASMHFIYHLSQFNTIFKNALASSGEGTRTLIFVGESAVNSTTLSYIEALRCAQSPHAIPATMLPSVQTQLMMENIKQNLGIVICLDKQQNNLSELMEKFPILYNDAHFVWLDRWSDNTLREMPTLVIQRLMKENVTEITKEQLESIPTDGFVKIHKNLSSETMRAPCRFVNFIKSYYNIVNRKRTTLVQRQSMLSSGVEALRRARSEVATLQAEATQQESLLSEKQAKANSALDQISATVRANTDKKEEMHALKMSIESENQKLQIQKKEIEAELASVEPVIAAARAAVGDLRPESLSEVRSLRAPPDVVRDVLEGVLRLMGIADTSWSAMKNFLSKRGVKEDIRCLDASQISPAALQNVQRLLEKRGASFEASTAKRASAACAPLAAWVRANVEYARALQRVQPLQAHQARLHKNLQEAEDQLTALSSGLASVDQRVSALKEQLGQHSRDAAAIEMRLNVAADTLKAAQNLLDQLAHEYTAWECDLENIMKEISELNQRSLLAAAYVVYLPDLTEPQAREHIKVWCKMIGFKEESFSVINFLSTTEKQLKWDADGLPSDQSAVKNAILIDQVLQTPKCGFTPLLIDPDGEGLLWLKNTLADVPCDFVSQHSEKLLTAVQYAVRLGRILVITDVDEVHDSWSMLLSGISTSNAGAFSPRLILQCRDATLPRRLSTHCSSRLSPTHFTPRLDGLTDQLINYALQQQNPEISGKSKEIKLEKANLQKQQYELQENLLRDLSSNSDILHDANLLASLNKTRETNTTISKALEAAREIERANNEACAKYEPSAKRAATLALAVKGLSARWPLVVLPVDAVLEGFVKAVRKADTLNINHEEIVKYLTRRTIERVLLALHKKDKYIVVLYLLKQVYEDLMPEKLWQLLIGTTESIEDSLNTSEIKKFHSWIPDECVKATAKLKATDEDLFNRLSLQNTELWEQFMASGDLNILSKLRLTPFETVASVAAVRPDSLYRAIVAFVDFILGTGSVFTSSPVQSAARCAGSRPVLVLGAHAADVLAAHAHEHTLIQVGVEQGLSAWQSALHTARSGGWLVLTVAASPFTRELQAFITDVAESTENYNEEFRMWVVSEYRDIPPLVSNACVNVILESPEGVKNNIMGTLSAWGNYEADPKMVRLHACLAIFHALVQERRAYLPQGWSRWYSWEWGEVVACAAAIKAGGPALCLPLYAARLQDAQDARLLSVLHARYLSTGTAPAFPVPLPTASSLQAYASAFSSLPDIDTPQLLGLPANCRGAWEKNAANNIVTVLRELNSTVSVDKSDGVASIKSLLGLWKKSMSGCPLLKAGWETPGGKELPGGWWGCVAGGEATAAARCARIIHAGLGQLARSLAHTHKHAMYEVPEEWQVVWSGPSAAEAYIREFSYRARAAVARLDNTQTGYMPTEVDLRSLLQPMRVIWALRAHSLARLNVSPERLVLVGTWDTPESLDVLYVVGVRACGCLVRGGALAAAPAHAPPYTPAPKLALRISTQSEDSAPMEGTIEVPVYSNETREDLLFTVRTPLSRDFTRDAALLNAVALFVAPLD